MAIDLRDHLTALQTGVIRWTAGCDLFHYGAVNVIASVQLLP
jgi:hypothetical protein